MLRKVFRSKIDCSRVVGSGSINRYRWSGNLDHPMVCLSVLWWSPIPGGRLKELDVGNIPALLEWYTSHGSGLNYDPGVHGYSMGDAPPVSAQPNTRKPSPIKDHIEILPGFGAKHPLTELEFLLIRSPSVQAKLNKVKGPPKAAVPAAATDETTLNNPPDAGRPSYLRRFQVEVPDAEGGENVYP